MPNSISKNYLFKRGKSGNTADLPIGLFAESSYQEKTIKLELPASLYLFSDGIYEVKKREGIYLSMNEFLPILRQYQELSAHQLDNLLELLHSTYQNSIFGDDASIIEINFWETT